MVTTNEKGGITMLGLVLCIVAGVWIVVVVYALVKFFDGQWLKG